MSAIKESYEYAEALFLYEALKAKQPENKVEEEVKQNLLRQAEQDLRDSLELPF